jgi:hypothetical protein
MGCYGASITRQAGKLREQPPGPGRKARLNLTDQGDPMTNDSGSGGHTATAEVISLTAKRRKRRKHTPRPRTGAELRRYEILTGYWGVGDPPMRHHYPMTALLGCTCGKSIRCQSPDEPWEHVQW